MKAALLALLLAGCDGAPLTLEWSQPDPNTRRACVVRADGHRWCWVMVQR